MDDKRNGSVERLDRETAQPGQYWRARKDIPEVRGVRNGTSRDAVPAGRVYLVKSLRIVDGDVHAVVLANHPSVANGSDLRFLEEEFHDLFGFEPRGAEIRAAEVEALTEEIRAIQQEIVLGPEYALPDPANTSVDLKDLVKDAGRRQALIVSADMQIEQAKKKSEWVQVKTRAIGQKVAVIGAFHAETAEAALAAVEGTIREVERIKVGLRSMRLYTGEDVEVDTVMEGEPAPFGEPLTIFQGKLYLDEELGVELATGGLDSDSFGNLERYLAANPAFLDRVAPAPRSVVLMTLRRRPNLPEEMTTPAMILEAIEKIRMDRAGFLFVRNGANVHLIWSDLVWSPEGARDDLARNGLARLFPSRNDIDKPFRGYDGSEITLADLDYSDARRRFDDRGLAYKRLLIMLWGLNDRLNLFGDFYDRDRFNSWTDLAFQQEHFRFVADEEFGLPVARLPVRDFIKVQNGRIQHGSRVIGRWDQALDSEVARDAFEWQRHSQRYTQKLHPDEKVSPAIVRRVAGRPTITLPGRDYNGNPRRIHADLQRHEDGYRRSGLLCLDGLRASDLMPYIESRRDRAEYDEYLWLFIAAAADLKKEESYSEGTRRGLIELAARSGADDADATRLADEAIMVWRVGHPGKPVPSSASGLGTLRAMVRKSAEFTLPDPPGQGVVRWSMDAQARLVRWIVPAGEETGFAPESLPFLRRDVMSSDGGIVGSDYVAFADFVDAEMALWNADGVDKFAKTRPPSGMTHAEWMHLRAVMLDDGTANYLVDGNPHAGYFAAARLTMGRHSSKGKTERVSDFAPIGLALIHEELQILVLHDDPVHVYARGSEQSLLAAKMWIKGHFQHPHHSIEALERAVEVGAPFLGYISIAQWRQSLDRSARPVYPSSISSYGRKPWREEFVSGRVSLQSIVLLPDIMTEVLDRMDRKIARSGAKA